MFISWGAHTSVSSTEDWCCRRCLLRDADAISAAEEAECDDDDDESLDCRYNTAQHTHIWTVLLDIDEELTLHRLTAEQRRASLSNWERLILVRCLQRPDWRVIYCNGLLYQYVFPARNIVNFLISFTFLTATCLSKARYSLFVLKVPLNLNLSVM